MRGKHVVKIVKFWKALNWLDESGLLEAGNSVEGRAVGNGLERSWQSVIQQKRCVCVWVYKLRNEGVGKLKASSVQWDDCQLSR